MAIENRKTEKVGVAHNGTILDVYDTVEEAQRQLDHYSQTAVAIGMRPAYDLVTTTESVTYSKAKPYTAPEPEQPADDAGTQTPTE